jgi:ABC-2 type transport system ATP-binding protein
MSGREFVRTMAKLNGFANRDVDERSEAVLTRVGMADRADRKIRGYSKGMRQRIKLAQALLHDPELLILDEPLSGIDPLGRQEMLDLFRSLAEQGKCLLISSHELEELEKLTDRVAILAKGRIASVGTLQQIRALFDDFPMSVRVVLDHPRELARHLLGLDGVLGFDLQEDGTGLTIRARNPERFFPAFGALLLEERIAIRELEPLDDSTHAILGYLLGGSGKT